MAILAFVTLIKSNADKVKEHSKEVYQLKSSYLKSLKSLEKYHRHECMNFFQIVYSYLQLNKKEKAIEQIKMISTIASNQSSAFKISVPVIAFLLSKKSKDAHDSGLSFTYNVKVHINEELRHSRNEEKIIDKLEDTFNTIIDFLSLMEEKQSLTVDIIEYKDKINIAFNGAIFRVLLDKIKEVHSETMYNDSRLIMSFGYEDIENLEDSESIYTKLLFN